MAKKPNQPTTEDWWVESMTPKRETDVLIFALTEAYTNLIVGGIASQGISVRVATGYHASGKSQEDSPVKLIPLTLQTELSNVDLWTKHVQPVFNDSGIKYHSVVMVASGYASNASGNIRISKLQQASFGETHELLANLVAEQAPDHSDLQDHDCTWCKAKRTLAAQALGGRKD